MKADRHIIWSNYALNYEDWRMDLEAEYPDLSDRERENLMYEINGNYLDDERANLNIQLSQPILVIADLGRWNGRFPGYKDGATEAQIDRLKEKIYNGTATRADITRVTRRLGDEIGKVYGWEFPQRSVQRAYER